MPDVVDAIEECGLVLARGARQVADSLPREAVEALKILFSFGVLKALLDRVRERAQNAAREAQEQTNAALEALKRRLFGG